MTHAEVARVLSDRGQSITKGGVWAAEKSAFRKLAEDPTIQALARDLGLLDGNGDED